ncbi:MAG: TRAP transporter substrate-binding protein [Acidobacteria bacterium]|nr:MAG: TRAP transporter substrate-binding protein [Acidobacteriota bacterium]REK03872.1 MAG: TRAP transporter substrate-binding protein [Acidobacteriota bacterium]
MHVRTQLLVALLLAAALPSCGPLSGGGPSARDGREVLRLGHGLDPSHPVHRAMEAMADELARRTGGRLRLEIFPSEQLGSERELLELLQIGSVELTKVSASVLESFAPSFRVLGVPYLFDDTEHQWRVLEGPVGDRLLASPEAVRLRGLAFYDAGARSFYTRDRPIRTPEDLAGLKIRTQESPSAIAMVRALGGNATPISWGELYTALQQGVVDGAENNPPSFHLSHHYEVARFYSLDEHTAVPDVLLASTALWKRLGAADREHLLAAARHSARIQRRLWKEASDEALRAVREAGVQVDTVDKAPFARRTAALRDELAREPEMAELLEAIEAQRLAVTEALP